METALATNALNGEAKSAARERAVPEIDPANVILDRAGQFSRHWVIRLPAGFVFGDLADTACWRKCQATVAKSVRRHDTVYLISYDESWCANAIVTDANAREASLANYKKVSMESRVKALLNDGTYHVEWRGNGFSVVRNADGQVMTQPVANETLANRELAQLYPRILT